MPDRSSFASTRAEILHDPQSHQDIRLGYQLARDGQFHVVGGVGSRHQQAAEELAGDIAADGRLASRQAAGPHFDRWKVRRGATRGTLRRVGSSASSRSPIGRSRMRFTPSSRNEPCPSVQKAREKANRRAAIADKQLGGGWRECVRRGPARPACGRRRCTSTRMPSCPSAAIITRVSSLSSAPVNVLSPWASAAQTRARLVMLLEPGGRMRPRTGPRDGSDGNSVSQVANPWAREAEALMAQRDKVVSFKSV